MGNNNNTENAKCTGVFIGLEDHGIPTCLVSLEGGGWGQSWGGYDLRYSNYAEQTIRGLCKVFEVNNVFDCKGKVVRIRRNGYFGPIVAIGHIYKDEWFNLG